MGEGEVAEELGIVGFGKVAAVVHPPAFLAGKGTADNGFGDIEGVFQIECRRPREVVKRPSGRGNSRQVVTQFRQFRESLLKLRMVPDHLGFAPHGFAQSIPQGKHGWAFFSNQRGFATRYRFPHFGILWRDQGHSLHPLGNHIPGNAPEHGGFRHAVAAQPIGPLQIGILQIGLPQFGFLQIGTPQIGTLQIGIPQFGSPQIGLVQITNRTFICPLEILLMLWFERPSAQWEDQGQDRDQVFHETPWFIGTVSTNKYDQAAC